MEVIVESEFGWIGQSGREGWRTTEIHSEGHAIDAPLGLALPTKSGSADSADLNY
jgi:hypothetical protein